MEFIADDGLGFDDGQGFEVLVELLVGHGEQGEPAVISEKFKLGGKDLLGLAALDGDGDGVAHVLHVGDDDDAAFLVGGDKAAAFDLLDGGHGVGSGGIDIALGDVDLDDGTGIPFPALEDVALLLAALLLVLEVLVSELILVAELEFVVLGEGTGIVRAEKKWQEQECQEYCENVLFHNARVRAARGPGSFCIFIIVSHSM